MKNKKTLHLAIALAISSMPLFGVAEAARGSMYGGESVGDDVTIEASANAYPSLVGHAFWYLYECYQFSNSYFGGKSFDNYYYR